MNNDFEFATPGEHEIPMEHEYSFLLYTYVTCEYVREARKQHYRAAPVAWPRDSRDPEVSSVTLGRLRGSTTRHI